MMLQKEEVWEELDGIRLRSRKRKYRPPVKAFRANQVILARYSYWMSRDVVLPRFHGPYYVSVIDETVANPGSTLRDVLSFQNPYSRQLGLAAMSSASPRNATLYTCTASSEPCDHGTRQWLMEVSVSYRGGPITAARIREACVSLLHG